MNNMIPFGQGQAPAFLTQLGMTPEQVAAMNSGAAVGTGGGGVNRISLKQSRFRLIVGGTETMVIPTLNIQLVIVRANDGVTKTWYEKEWTPDQGENTAPDCSSDDGIVPRMDSPKRQANSCATCPMNEWGSKTNKLTGAKIKACTDGKTMAILAPGANGQFGVGDLYQLKTPPASLGEFGGFVKGLSSLPQPVPYNAVVADVSFDPQANFPKLLFKPVRYLDAQEYELVAKRYNEDETKRIAGLADVQTMRTPQLAAPQQAPVQQQAPQQAPVQQYAQPQNPPVQQAPVQQQAPQQAASGWGGEPVGQQAAPGANSGWGSPAQAQPQQGAQTFERPQSTAPSGWGDAAPQQQAPVQQAPQQAASGWGDAAPVQQQAPQQAAAGWGDAAPVQQQAPQQQAPQQQAPQQQAGNGVVLMAGGREHGKAPAGKKRRTAAEIAEDEAYTAQAGGQAPQQAPVQQAPVQQQAPQPAADGWGGQPQTQAAPQQAAAGWGDAAPVQQAPQQQAAAGWGDAAPQQQQAAPQQAAPAFDANNPWANGNAQPQQGAPIQPNVVQSAPGGMPAFQGWDDQPAQ
jgi:hypothetical protein